MGLIEDPKFSPSGKKLIYHNFVGDLHLIDLENL